MDSYAVIGHPIAHSKSPLIHRQFAQQTNQPITYDAIEAPLDAFAETVKQFRQSGGKGCNVTLPFKEQAYQLATQHSPLAKEAGAANTLVFKENKIYADSTDGPGLVNDLVNNHQFVLAQKKLLILGAGGVVKCITGPLFAGGAQQIVIANRTTEKAMAIAKQFSSHGNIEGCGLEAIPDLNYDLIINATSSGINGETPNIKPALIMKQKTWCYDLFYADKPTAFLAWAAEQGAAKCMDGLGMLVEQAAVAFYLWRGVYPETQSVIQQLSY